MRKIMMAAVLVGMSGWGYAADFNDLQTLTASDVKVSVLKNAAAAVNVEQMRDQDVSADAWTISTPLEQATLRISAQSVEAELKPYFGRYKLQSGSNKCQPNMVISAFEQAKNEQGVMEKWFDLETSDNEGFQVAVKIQEKMYDMANYSSGPGVFSFDGPVGSYGKERITILLSSGKVVVDQRRKYSLPMPPVSFHMTCEYTR